MYCFCWNRQHTTQLENYVDPLFFQTCFQVTQIMINVSIIAIIQSIYYYFDHYHHHNHYNMTNFNIFCIILICARFSESRGPK